MFVKDKQVKTLEVYNTDSRYSKSSVFYDKTEGEYFTDLPKSTPIPTSANDSFFKVTVKTMNRLDLIANTFYKNSKLWWVIAEANFLDDPTIVPEGTNLIIPNISSIYGMGGVLG